MTTLTLGARRRMARIGEAICAGDRSGCRHLVEQRLEQVVIAPVDDDDVGRRAGQAMRGTQSAEARADDDDARPGHGGVHQRTGSRASNRTSPRVRGPNKVSVK